MNKINLEKMRYNCKHGNFAQPCAYCGEQNSDKSDDKDQLTVMRTRDRFIVNQSKGTIGGSFTCHNENHYWIYSGNCVPEGLPCQCGAIQYKTKVCEKCGQPIQ